MIITINNIINIIVITIVSSSSSISRIIIVLLLFNIVSDVGNCEIQNHTGLVNDAFQK